MKRNNIDSIEFSSIGFSYGEKIILKGVDLQLSADDINLIQGPGGSGKKTLLKLLLGIHAPTHGEYRVNGLLMNSLSHNEFDQFRLNMGYMSDGGGLINNLTLFENFKILLDYHGFAEQDHSSYIVSLLKRFDIDQHKDLRPSFVSNGVKKAAGILRALALKPQCLILSHPTQGLSPEHVPILNGLIEEYKREHNLKFVVVASDNEKFCNHLNAKIHLLHSSDENEKAA